MKSFFEEYGFVALAAIVVVLLIAMASPIGTLIRSQVELLVNTFATKTDTLVNTTINSVDNLNAD